MLTNIFTINMEIRRKLTVYNLCYVIAVTSIITVSSVTNFASAKELTTEEVHIARDFEALVEPTAILGEEELMEFDNEKHKNLPPKKDNTNDLQNQKVKKGFKNEGGLRKSVDTFREKFLPPIQTCVPVSIPVCRQLDLYPLAQYPNTLGHRTAAEALKALKPYLSLLKDEQCGNVLREFVCLLYAPQCSGTDEPLLPCKAGCKNAREACSSAMKRSGIDWPTEWTCDRFSQDVFCAEMLHKKVTPVPEPAVHDLNHLSQKYAADAMSVHTKPSRENPPIKNSVIKPRNYNIGQLGQSEFFQGWADVQGQGAANDYCRVIGSSPNLRFLSCTLGGSTKPDHVYVSKRGFDVGHRHTWFMKDADGDGRDDYCRCVGKGLQSYVSCMKAGKYGFYGSPQEPGNEYTFMIKTDGPCFQKKVNPFIGI